MSKSMPLEAAREAKNQRAASTPISPSSSSRVMNSPERLRHRDLFAVPNEADPGGQDHLDLVAVEAERLGGGLDAGHVAVMVLAPDEDDALVAAAELLDQIADVGGEVGGRGVAGRAQDHPVLVVAVLGRSEDDRAVLARRRRRQLAAARPPWRPSRRCGACSPSARRRNGSRGVRGWLRCRLEPSRTPTGRRPSRGPRRSARPRPGSRRAARGPGRRRSRRGSRPRGSRIPRGSPRPTRRGS